PVRRNRVGERRTLAWAGARGARGRLVAAGGRRTPGAAPAARRAGAVSRRLVVGKRSARRNRSQPTHAAPWYGRTGDGRGHRTGPALAFLAARSRRAPSVRSPAHLGADPARAARRPGSG